MLGVCETSFLAGMRAKAKGFLDNFFLFLATREDSRKEQKHLIIEKKVILQPQK